MNAQNIVIKKKNILLRLLCDHTRRNVLNCIDDLRDISGARRGVKVHYCVDCGKELSRSKFVSKVNPKTMRGARKR